MTPSQEVFIDHFDRLDDNLKDTLQADCNKFDAGLNIIAVCATPPPLFDNEFNRCRTCRRNAFARFSLANATLSRAFPRANTRT